MALPKWRSLFLTALMVGILALPLASAADSDSDGIDDSVDDCPYFMETRADRSGCRQNGDGTSDVNDGWTSQVSQRMLR